MHDKTAGEVWEAIISNGSTDGGVKECAGDDDDDNDVNDDDNDDDGVDVWLRLINYANFLINIHIEPGAVGKVPAARIEE